MNRNKWIKRAVIGAITLVILGFGFILLYAKVLNDSPDEFTADDIDAALAVTTTAAPPASETAAPATVDTQATATADTQAPATVGTEAPSGAGTGSTWTATDPSEVGYRVEEVLFGVDTTAVGRTNSVTGSLTIDGTQLTAAEFTVDVASIASDESRRDGQFKNNIMSASEFPTATFVLTAPIELGVAAADGAVVTASATGDLTLRGVTNTVTFDVNAKQDNGLIGVQGSIPVVFADYQIANPSFGGIKTEDNGLVEFVLVFAPA